MLVWRRTVFAHSVGHGARVKARHSVHMQGLRGEEQVVSIELSKEDRAQAVASIERYFNENMEERIGNIAAGALLTYFLEEIGPSVYNKAVAEVQERLNARILELDIEIHEEEFQYWPKQAKAPRPRR